MVASLGTAAAVIFSILWLDRPIASFAHDHFRYLVHGPVVELSYFPNPLFLLALALPVILMLQMTVHDNVNEVTCLRDFRDCTTNSISPPSIVRYGALGSLDTGMRSAEAGTKVKLPS